MPVLRLSDFARKEAPSVTIERESAWSGLSLLKLAATRGHHEVGPAEDHRILLFTAGAVNVDCTTEDVRSTRMIAPGDIDLVPSGAMGSWFDYAPTEMALLRLSPEAMTRLVEQAGARAPGDLAPRLGWRDPQVEHLIRALVAELYAAAPAGQLYVDALSTGLALRLAQAAGVQLPLLSGQTLTPRQVKRIESFIAANLAEDLSLAAVAGAADISVSHLTPMFRRTMGMSVHRYVLEQRVRQAQVLLTTTKQTVAEIALRTGFAHQSHLARWMRRILRATPTDVRAASRGGR